MNSLEYENYMETKAHADPFFPYNTYLCSIPLDFNAVPLHWHPYMEIIYIKKGKGNVTLIPSVHRHQKDIGLLWKAAILNSSIPCIHMQSKRQRPQTGKIIQRIWIVPKRSYLISTETTKKQYPLRTLLLTVDSLNPILCDFLRIRWVYPLPPICVISG